MKNTLLRSYFLLATIGLGMCVAVNSRASSYSLISSDWSYFGRAFGSANPGFGYIPFNYTASGGGGADPEHVTMGPSGPGMPTFKLDSFGNENGVSFAEIPLSQPFPTIYDLAGVATSSVLFTPNFSGSGDDIVFHGTDLVDGGGTVTIVDADTNALLFQNRYGYRRWAGDFSFTYGSWEIGKQYRLVMQVDMAQSGPAQLNLSNNMQFTAPASVTDSTSALSLIFTALGGLTLFRRLAGRKMT